MVRTLSTMLLGLLLACSPVGSQQSEDRWDEYEPRSLESVIDINKADITPELNAAKKPVLISGHNFPTRVTLTYLGKSRPLSGKRRVLYGFWSKTFVAILPPDSGTLFETEVLFKEGSTQHWILVQKPLLEYFPKEVKAGDQVTAYVIFMGAIRVKGHWEWLFAMNEFDKPGEPK